MTDPKPYNPWPDRVAFPPVEDQARFSAELVDVLTRGHAAGMEVAGWVSAALEAVARTLPNRVEGLLRQRPGSWEAEHIRRLAAGAEFE